MFYYSQTVKSIRQVILKAARTKVPGHGLNVIPHEREL